MNAKHCIALGAALLALAGSAPAASADSIAYIKDGNVHLSTPDGSRHYQVTSGGGYSDVSQADDGTMIALHGIRLHKLARDGAVLADFATPVSDVRPPGQRYFYGPFDPAISPDGTKVAYTYYFMTQSQNPSCYPPACYTTINGGGTGYSFSDRLTAWDVPNLGHHSGWRHPAWIDNDNTMLSNPTRMPNRDIVLDRISDGGNGNGNMLRNWTSDLVDGNPHVSGGDITRDKRKLAFQTGENDSTLSLYYVPRMPTSWKDGDPDTDEVHVCYRYSKPAGGKHGVPSFAPDGSAIAYHTGDGIHVAAVPSFANGCTLEGATVTPPLVIAGATEPDWGPADVPAPRQAPMPAPGAPLGPGPGSGSGSQPGTSGSTQSRSLSVRVAAAKRSGVTIRVKAPGKGKLTATAKRGSKTVGKASKKVKKAGTTSIKVKVRGKGKVSLKIAFKPASGATITTTATARIR